MRNNEPKNENSEEKVTFPRTIRARPIFEEYQVRFFETVAVPQDLLERIYTEGEGAEILKAFSQWRVDFPIKKYKPTLNEKERQIISVLEKILTRGRITLPSPKIEEEFKEIFKLKEKNFSSLSLEEFLLVKGYKKAQKKLWLDSEEENIFYEEILLKFLGENYEQFVLPQVEISTLLPPNINGDVTKYQRVDFAIFHPSYPKMKIIVEIDGSQHKANINSDKERDEILKKYGYTVFRIPADEIRERKGSQLSNLGSILSGIKTVVDLKNNKIIKEKEQQIKFIYSIKIAHQIQIVILQALQSGFLSLEAQNAWYIFTDINEIGIFNEEEAFTILKSSVADFIELLDKLSKLYSFKLNIKEPVLNLSYSCFIPESANGIWISFSNKNTVSLPTFYIQNIYLPFPIANSSFSAPPVRRESLAKPPEKDLEYFLQYLFRKPYFWEGQYEGIARILQGKDTLLLLPTGGGKSLVYQLASLLLPGRTVVIDPIIALMKDQIDNLRMIGIDRCIDITSQIINPQDRKQVLQLFGQGEYLFVFVAPERFQTEEFRNSLRELTVHTPIALVVIDEAHCVSEWGHDFRTAYLNIGKTSRNYCKSNEYIPPLVGLTGTASRAVLKDVKRELLIEDFDAIITPKSFDRKELKFEIIHCKSEEKIFVLKGYLKGKLPNLFGTQYSILIQPMGKDTYSGLIFCPHVNGEFGVVEVANKIKKDLGIAVGIYTGKDPMYWKSEDYMDYKKKVTIEFKRNKKPLMVCTKAFGMGIDKPNIRYTIHFNIPPSIESFYQEAGRAGRDRKDAYCCIIVSIDDSKRAEKLLNPNTTIEEIDEIIEKIKREENDDITRILYFHTKSFKGINEERENIEEILRQIGDVAKKEKKIITIPNRIKQKYIKKKDDKDRENQAREATEKALYRLLVLGIISDYTIDYSRNEFTIELSGATKEEIIEAYGQYVASYQESRKQHELEEASKWLSYSYSEFIKKMISRLLYFVYDVIERARRERFRQMVLICKDAPSNEKFRQLLLKYLEETEYSQVLEKIVSDKEVDFKKVKEFFWEVVVLPTHAEELRGSVSRFLGDYPDHPGLYMLRALSEAFSKDKNYEVVKDYFIAGVSFAFTRYGLSGDTVFDFAIWGISHIAKQDKNLAKELIFELLKKFSKRSFAKAFIKELPIELIAIPAWFLLAELEKDLRQFDF